MTNRKAGLKSACKTPFARVEQPGLHTAIQDGGRLHLRHLGMPQSGAADRLSFAMANAAVGNHWDRPALECAFVGPSIEFLAPIRAAVAGADMGATLNGKRIRRAAALDARPGDRLAIGGGPCGARAYLAFAGGVAGDRFMQSASTFLPAGIGGYQGRLLAAGDQLFAARAMADAPPRAMDKSFFMAPFGHGWVLRALPGPEFDGLIANAKRDFFSKAFTAGARGDRMGVRMERSAMTFSALMSLKSGPVLPGTVQCPPDGAPFLLGPDAQTHGGYPRLAQVIDADLHLIGQIRPGDKIWFRRVNAEEARAIAKRRAAMISVEIPGFRFA